MYLKVNNILDKNAFVDEKIYSCLRESIDGVYDDIDYHRTAYYERRRTITALDDEMKHLKVSDINWKTICLINSNIRKGSTSRTNSLSTILIEFLSNCIRKNIYQGNDIEIVAKVLEVFLSRHTELFAKKVLSYSETDTLLDYIWKFKGSNLPIEKKRVPIFSNDVIKELYCEWYERFSKKRYKKKCQTKYEFEISLGKYINKIKSYKDFNERTFWEQINYFRAKAVAEKDVIYEVADFYRFLVEKYPEYSFFDGATTLSIKLLYNNALSMNISRGYRFMQYNPFDEAPTDEKIVFILRGMDRFSGKFDNDDFISIDLSIIEDEFYRKYVYEFIFSKPSNIVNTELIVPAIKQVFPKLLEHKKNIDVKGYNKDYYYNSDALFIRQQIMNRKDISKTSKAARLSCARRFLLWMKNNNYASFDDMFFEYLGHVQESRVKNAKAIPDEHLVAINENLLRKSKDDIYYYLVYAAFQLLLQTEFRAATICKLDFDCIEENSFSNGQYSIRARTKVGHGDFERYYIATATKHLLEDVIEKTSDIRKEAPKSLRNKLFLYRSLLGISCFNTTGLSKCISRICKEENIPHYTCQNLRDTHMTKALEYVMQNNMSDLELSMLTSHKKFKTTINHYIDMNIDTILESTYGITIGNIEGYAGNIVDAIPEEFDNEESAVENGCGKCTSKICSVKSSIPCMTCKSFVTTVAHEKYFKRAIELIDKKIRNSNYNHDKEDLTYIKKLYVGYLREIYRKKEYSA